MGILQSFFRHTLIFIAASIFFINFAGACGFSPAEFPAAKIDPSMVNAEYVKQCEVRAQALVDARRKMETSATQCSSAVGGVVVKKVSDEAAAEQSGGASRLGDFNSDLQAKLLAQTEEYAKACHAVCKSFQSELKPDDKDMPAKVAQQKMNEIHKSLCEKDLSEKAKGYAMGMSEASYAAYTAKKAKKSLLTKVAIGAAVVGGGALLIDHIGDKKAKKKKEKKEEEEKLAKEKKENGVIKDASGNEIVCFSSQNFSRLECAETMLSLCQGAKADTAGCRAFNSNYCASSGSDSNYCLFSEAKKYCTQQGAVIAQSPACQWLSARPSSCQSNAESVSCLHNVTPDALNLACANFPNDPLCGAHKSGRIVVQGGSSSTASTAEVAAGSAAGGAASSSGASSAENSSSGSSVTMSSVLDNSSSTSASATDTSASSEKTVLAVNQNLWASSAAVSQKACANGLLEGCN